MMKLTAVFCLLFVFSATLEAHRGRTKPHIVLIVGDDIGFNDLGFQGGNGMPTPTLNQLAAEGVILEDQYVSPWCTPTRAALMTGRYPIRYGLNHLVAVPNQRIGLPLTEKILPEFLKEQGYANHLVGKWHLGMYDPAYLPTSRGFDTFYGTYFNVHHTTHVKTVSNADLTCPSSDEDTRGLARSLVCSELYTKLTACVNASDVCEQMLGEYHEAGCFECSFDFEMDDSHFSSSRVRDELPATFSGYNWQEDTPTSRQRSTKREGMYSTKDITEQALDILDAHDEQDPLFMTLAFTVVHTPIVVDEENAAAECSDGRYPYPSRSDLCTMVHGLDNGIARVVQKLKDKNMYHNSVIIFLSDNGGVSYQSSNHPFRGQKSTLWQGGVRVPSFIHAPGRLQQTGISKPGYIHAVDWFTTIRSLAQRGSRRNDDDGCFIDDDDFLDGDDEDVFGKTKIDGKNMWRFLSRRNAKSPRNEILLNIDPLCAIASVDPLYQTIGPHAAYIFKKWKYIEGDPGIPLVGNCFNGDGSALPDSSNLYCPFPLNDDGVGLIDLENDPTETTNVADENPSVVALLKLRVAMFELQMEDPAYGDVDPLSDPSLYGGWWTPWVNNDDADTDFGTDFDTDFDTDFGTD